MKDRAQRLLHIFIFVEYIGENEMKIGRKVTEGFIIIALMIALIPSNVVYAHTQIDEITQAEVLEPEEDEERESESAGAQLKEQSSAQVDQVIE